MKELLESYKRGKEKYNNLMLLVGDGEHKYYMFGDDAETAHALLGTYLYIVTDENIKASYFEYKDLDTNLSKLIRAGKRVAII